MVRLDWVPGDDGFGFEEREGIEGSVVPPVRKRFFTIMPLKKQSGACHPCFGSRVFLRQIGSQLTKRGHIKLLDDGKKYRFRI